MTIHAKDLARTSLEFDGLHLQRRVGNPTIHMALEYSSRTGVARTLIKGGEKYNRMLADAFAEHLLGAKIKAQRLKPPPLDLSGLRSGFHVPQAHQDGFAVVQLKSITVITPDKKLRGEFNATAASQQQSVSELMAENLPNDESAPVRLDCVMCPYCQQLDGPVTLEDGKMVCHWTTPWKVRQRTRPRCSHRKPRRSMKRPSPPKSSNVCAANSPS